VETCSLGLDQTKTFLIMDLICIKMAGLSDSARRA